ncbi:MFS transporter [Rosenbergiella collisarenosi]|uniref:MFS transporter n=1 Tax=Rosenbergiella collisarenosi TaxID=1544695 RepID=UPI001F4DD595|nr:MFS transporter [Rosenbergiella collisarenosi]
MMREDKINTASQRMATRSAFFIAGFAMGVWAPLVPYARQRLELDEKSLGSLLLCLGLGSLLTMLFSGKLVGRFGCRSIITLGALCIASVLPLLATVHSLPLMIVSLFIFGAGVGMTDVTVNVQGTMVEKAANQPLMSGFHGLFSIGGIVGAAVGSIVLSAGLSPLMMALCASLLIVVILSFSFTGLLPVGQYGEESHPQRFKADRPLIIMALMCLVCFLAEGSMLDWSGIWLTSNQGLDLAYAGWGYAAFGTTMAIMRLLGDKIVLVTGRKVLLLISGSFTLIGFILVVLFPSWQVSLCAFALIGLGAANVVPIVTTLAGNHNAMPSNLSVAYVSTVGYLGILLGPAIIGFIAHAASLSSAFLCIAVVLLVIIYGALSLSTTSV